jgi:hypothetical protein
VVGPVSGFDYTIRLLDKDGDTVMRHDGSFTVLREHGGWTQPFGDAEVAAIRVSAAEGFGPPEGKYGISGPKP